MKFGFGLIVDVIGLALLHGACTVFVSMCPLDQPGLQWRRKSRL